MAHRVLIPPRVTDASTASSSTNSSTGTTGDERALEFRIGRARLAVRLDRVARVIEVSYAPLPLAHPLVIGIGFEDARPLVCVALTRARPAAAGATTRAVLLDLPGQIGWALCIDEVFSLSQLVRWELGGQSKLPAWVGRARTSDGRTVGWIDPDGMIGDLSAGEGARP